MIAPHGASRVADAIVGAIEPTAVSSVAAPHADILTASARPVAALDTHAFAPRTAPHVNGTNAVSSVTVTFRQGVSGYSGATDTFIHDADATSHATATTLTTDLAPNVQQTLLRFGNLFASEGGPIPNGASITSATLQINVTNATTSTVGFYALKHAWADTALWSTFGASPWNGTAGVQVADGAEVTTSPDVAQSFNLGPQTITVTSRLQAWAADPSSNFGWALDEIVDDGLGFDSGEAVDPAGRPLLTVTYDPPTGPCVNNGDCNDANACTTDTCNLGNGVCSHVPTTCAWGTCNAGSGVCEVTLTFQNGVAGYSGTVDTYLDEANPATSHATDASFFMDNDPTDKQGLLRFDGIFGSNGTSQIPPGSTIRSATLNVNVNDPSDTGAALHRMLACWQDTNTWTTFGAGIDANGIEAATTPDASGLLNSTGPFSFSVTSSVAAWSAGQANLGWALLPLGGSGWAFDSSEGTIKPQLSVTFTPPAACANDAACSDGNGCTSDTCSLATGFCSHAVNVGGSCSDGISCTNDTCSACGRCSSVDGCTSPQVCNTSSGQCQAPALPPNAPSNPSPANGATGVTTSPQLCVDVSDPNGDNLNVTFKGRLAGQSSGQPFTVIALPDTQFYACGIDCPSNYPAGQATNGPIIFNAQTQWIVDNRISRNIAFVTQLGDCVNDGNAIPREWPNADAAFDLLENPATTGLTFGIPYGIAAGNHDQTGNGVPRNGTDEGQAFGGSAGTFSGTTQYFNQTFGRFRFAGRSYFGNNYDFGNPSLYADSMDNHYELFSASGMDFIVFHLEYDTGCSWPSSGSPTPPLSSCQGVLSWMRGVLATYPSRRGIITTHWMATPGSTTAFSTQGQAIFNAVKDLPNVFMLLGGHLDQASHREDLATDGHKIYTIPTDYQSRPQGGGGWLRIMTFDPGTNSIHIETYSPFYNRFINKPLPRHADDQANESPSTTDPTAACYWTGTTGHSTNGSCNELLLSYSMDSGGPYGTIATVNGAHSGDRVCVPWTVETLNPGAGHQWYVDVSDASSTTTGPVWSFTTGTCVTNADCDDTNGCTTDTCNAGSCSHGAIAGCCNVAADCDDGNPCNGSETCSAQACQAGPAPNCSDGNACTTDSCVNPTGCAHTYAPTAGCCTTAADCNDGAANTTDTCVSGTCHNDANATCTTNAQCDDGDACTSDTCVGGNASALFLDGTNDYVTMGQALGLNAETFTVEAWIRWTGTTPGATILTGTGGITLVPIVAKGGPEADASVVDANYIVGLRDAGSGNWTLAADMEEHSTGSSPGLNHPVLGTIPIPADTWTHVAVTYDRAGAGTGTWRLFVNGNLDTALSVGQPPNFACTQHFALGTLLTSTGAQANNSGTGQFHGYLDEVRVWGRALPQIEIQAGMNQEIVSGTALLGRWGLNDNAGVTAVDSASSPVPENGTLTNGPAWSPSVKPNLGTGTCQHSAIGGCCTTAAQCDDANVCTTDSCTGNVCQHANNTASCNDGNACTTDVCSGGACVGTYAPTAGCCTGDAQCNDGLANTTDTCSLPAGNCQNVSNGSCTVAAECDDTNVCTTDTCATANTAGLSFDGTDDYVDFGNAASLVDFGTGSFTVEGWIYTDGGNNDRTGIFRYGQQGAHPQIAVQFSGSAAPFRNLTASVETNVSPTQVDTPITSTATLVPVNTWTHFAMVADRDSLPGNPAGQILRLYINGTEAANVSGSLWSTNVINATDAVMVGAARLDGGAPSLYYDGRVDELRIWNTARTAAQIQATMNLQVTSATGLVHRWGMNEGTGSSTADSVGSSPGALKPTPPGNAPAWVTGAGNLPNFGNGTCAHTPIANCCTSAAQCDDGNVCTDDACVANQCTHTNNTSPCNDGSACTQSDSCSGGVCVGSNPITCTALDQCHDVGTCNPATGVCSSPNKTNGTACNDGTACTQTDTCQSGICTGGNPVVCTALDACHVAGTCNPATGICTSPNASNGTTCSDGNACTTGDVCTNGTCGGTPLNCDDANQCTADTCSGGVCSHAPTPGASCNDGNVCTSSDTCTGSNTTNVVGTQNCTEAQALSYNGSTAWINVDKAWTHTYAPITGTITGATLAIEMGDGDSGPLTIVSGATTLGTITSGDNGGPGNFTCLAPGFADNVLTIPSSLFADLADGSFSVSTSGCSPTCASPPGTYSLSRATLTIQVAPTCGGTAVPGCCLTNAECADTNPCTVDTCVSNACVHTAGNDGTTCTDNSACTSGDVCSGGSCVGTAINCDDGNLCTNDSCNPATGCVHANNTVSCATDGNPCTDDVCSGGSCAHVPNNANSCTDGNACTGDACVNGTCTSWYAPAAGCCSSSAQCNDGVASTTDTCVGAPTGSCTNLVAGSCTTSAQCNDGNGCTNDTCVGATSGSALSFDGTNDYVTMGAAAGTSALGATTFTLETWLKWTGSGVATSTGGGGIASLIPLVTKGAAQAETPANVNANYILGISGGRLAGDFEDTTTGLNHPVCTQITQPTITTNVWHHAAATYNGTCWALYLDGVALPIDTSCSSCAGGACTVCPSATPESTSIQHFGLGTTLTSTGVASGFYQGSLDEARVWNVARTQAQIQASQFQEITSATNLIGRWGLNENTGLTANDSTTPAENGTLTNGPAWISDSPFPSNPGTCSSTTIPSCTPCAQDYQCNDGNQCTTDSCTTANVAAVDLHGGSNNRYVDLGNDGNTANVNYLTNFGTNSFTVEGWFWADSAAVDAASIFRMGSQGTAPQVVVQVRTGQKLAASVETSAGFQVDTVTQPTFTLGAWHHFALVVVRDLVTTANQRMSLYLDGTLAESSNASTWATNAINDSILSTTRDSVLLGAARTGPGVAPSLFFDGRLDEVRIWNSARTAQQISDNMNKQIVSATGLMHRWAFNEGTGTLAADSVGTNTGTLTNGATWRTLSTDLPNWGPGQCVFATVANGTSCSDGNVCTQNDACQSGACVSGGPAPSGTACGSSSDTACDNPDTCNGSGDCVTNNEANGTSCSDGNACTTGDSCQGGSCVSGTPVTCNAPPACHTAVGATCNSGTGVCSYPAATDGTACSDGNACTTGDSCQGGSCVSGTPVTCNAPPACHTAVGATCDSGTGACSYPASTDGTLCTDGNACTTGDSCQGGSCVSGTPVTCNAPPACHTAVGATCDSGTGACSYPAATDGTSCSDGDACTTGDSCQSGSCVSGGPVTCTAPPACHTAVGATCNAGTGLCSYPAVTDGTSCTDGNACTNGDSCQGGNCVSGTPVTCNAPPVCHTAVGATCNAGTGLCSYPTATDGAPCSDGNACTSGESCQGGVCQGGVAPAETCNGVDDDCNGTVDDGGNALCSDGDACTADTCIGAGGCVYSAICGVNGTVFYYRDNAAGGTEPSAKPVPNVGIDRTADALADATTGGTGAYALAAINGSFSVTTVPKYGNPRIADHNGAISSLDASTIARGAVGLVTLSPNQRIAGDVSGNGTLSALDASAVARFAIGAVNHFDVAIATGSDWKFMRCDAYAFPGDPGCGAPAYNFTPITHTESGKNFYAVLYGDVTGNWQAAATLASTATARDVSFEERQAIAADRQLADVAAAHPPVSRAHDPSSGPAAISIEGTLRGLRPGERRDLTIAVANADGILGLDLVLTYDASRYAIRAVAPAALASGWSVVHADQRGTQRIAAYGITPLAGGGPVVTLSVERLSDVVRGKETPVGITGTANEGQIPLRTQALSAPVTAKR